MLDLSSKRVTVMGLGRFGGGVGVARFLVSRGADVLVTDTAPADQLAASVAKLTDLPVKFRLGEHNVSDFTTADLIVVNPAVDPRDNRFLRAAAAAGVPTTSEIRLLIQHLPNRLRTIGVTGSAGKSTTTAMIGHILAAHVGPDRIRIGGNLGGSLLGEIQRIAPDDWVVLELSSFMLDDMRSDGWSPHIAVVTNLSPNHLDRHGSLEAYAAAKQTLFDHQAAGDFAVMGPGTERWFTPKTEHVVRVERPAAIEMLVPGEHNRLNAAMAITACRCAGVAESEAVAAVQSFAGLPHRLQLVCEHAEVRYYNDSKATTPEATMLALEAFDAATPVHLILGGYDKGSDLGPLAARAAQRCRAVYTIGKTGDAIAAAADAAPGRRAEIVRAGKLDHAVEEIVKRVQRGDVVLLSPACASWGDFDNYEHRGAAFVAGVLRCTGEGSIAGTAQG